jgi:hypothetical protein
MKRLLLILTVGLMLNLTSLAQDSSQNSNTEKKKPSFCMDVSLGYVFDKDYDALRASASVNNFILKRFGVFTAFEKNFNTDYFTHILGVTGSINHFSYIFAGMDFFTKYGLFQNGGWKGTRKDIGIGLYPWKWVTVKLGYSFSVHLTAEVGVRIPLGSSQN